MYLYEEEIRNCVGLHLGWRCVTDCSLFLWGSVCGGCVCGRGQDIHVDRWRCLGMQNSFIPIGHLSSLVWVWSGLQLIEGGGGGGGEMELTTSLPPADHTLKTSLSVYEISIHSVSKATES